MKLLIITSRVPWPLDKGDKLRIYHQIRYLSKSFEVELIALSSEDENENAFDELSKFCSKIHFINISKSQSVVGVLKAFFSKKPLQVGYFYNAKINREITAIIKKSKPDFLYGQLIRVADYLQSYNIPKVLDLQDAFSKGLQRRAEKAKGVLQWILNTEYKRMLAYEQHNLGAFDGLSIITDADRKLLPQNIQERTIIVPNGVDFDFFKPQNTEKQFNIVFTGNMSYAPNVMAAEFLVNKIMPLVWKRYPQINVILAGATPHNSVMALASDRVKVSGWLDNIREAYAYSDVFVAPMQIGTGLQNKLLEAMAMSMPCITSELANKALKATNGEHILIGSNDDAESYAKHIIKLIADKEYANIIAEKGHQFVKQNYDWKSAVDKLEALFNK